MRPEDQPAPLPAPGIMPKQGPLPPQSLVPFQSIQERFIGRTISIWMLHNHLQKQHFGFISGRSGLGKTQLAIEYAYRFSFYYPGGIYWIDTRNSENHYPENIAGKLGLVFEPKLSTPERIKILSAFLNNQLPSLLIFDNVSETTNSDSWMPFSKSTHVLFISKTSNLKDEQFLELPPITIEDSLFLMSFGERKIGSEALLLLSEVGGIPFLLNSLRYVLNQKPHRPILEILESMNEPVTDSKLKKFVDKFAEEFPNNKATFLCNLLETEWKYLSLDQIEILKVLAYLAPIPIALDFLTRVLKRINEKWELQINANIEELDKKYSLVQLDEHSNPFLHPTVLSFVQEKGEPAIPLSKNIITTLKAELSSVFNGKNESISNYLDSLIIHLEFLLQGQKIPENELLFFFEVLLKFHKSKGRYLIAYKYGLMGIALLEDSQILPLLKSQHLPRVQSNLALVLRSLNRHEEALTLLKKSLSENEKVLGSDHLSILVGKSNLALILKGLGRIDEARSLLELTLGEIQSQLKPNHPSLLGIKVNLAVLLISQEEYLKAMDLLNSAYKNYLEVNGEHNGNTKATRALIEFVKKNARFKAE